MDWRKASVPKKNTPVLMRATVLADENEIPDNHVLTVRDRVLSTDLQRIVQNNVKTDTVTLDLDGEWDDCTVYVTFNDETSQSGPWSLKWEGQPLTIPPAIGAVVGPVAVSVVGYGSDGELRLVTEAAPALMNVVKSGYVEIVDDNEENKDILSQLVAAGQKAEDAAEAANTAATSANSAATKANSAAGSANTAASSANSAATKANSAAVDAQNAYDTLKPYMATIDSCANILHREVGADAVVTADDSFPCKPVEMVVYGNTVQNLWVNPSGASNGVTVTANADGSVTISGTSTGSLSNNVQIYVLKPNTQYTASIDKAITGATNSSISFFVGNGSKNYYFGYVGATTITFTTGEPNSAGAFVCGFYMSSAATGTPVSGTYRVMLNEGSTAEPWCPPGLNSVGDGGSVEVVTAGKNLIENRNNETEVTNGVTFTKNYDGSVHASGTATSKDAIYTVVDMSRAPALFKDIYGKQVTLSGCPSDGSHSTFCMVIQGAEEDGIGVYDVGGSATATVSNYTGTCQIFISVRSGVTIDKTFYPQLELGSAATDYEPPNITTTPIDLQGHTLNALPDGTRDELHIDGGGNVVLEKRCGVAVAPASSTPSMTGTFDNVECAVYNILKTGVDAPYGDGNAHPDFVLCDKYKSSTGYGKYHDVDSVSTSRNDGGSIHTVVRGTTSAVLARTILYKLAEPQTIDLGTITTPTMAAPNVTAYVADDTPAEMILDYVRDVNIVHSRLEERVAALELASATSL